MTQTTTPTTPREIDTELATVWQAIYTTRDRLAAIHASLLSYAGAEWHYRGRQRVTNMPVAEAVAYCRALLETHADQSDYARFDLQPPIHGSAGMGNVRGTMARYDELTATLEALRTRADELEVFYAGWSRFFLVTSSAGHVHSSMHCSTCKLTTTYGWLPELSGSSEAEAVQDLGPTLCSVCFASAPVDWTTGKKLTAAQAARRAERS